ncbi:MAG: FtsX-like permease family protein [Bacteroidota bacterium]
MKFKHITEIARALLMARLKQTMVAAIGVAFSVTMFVTLLSFMNGLNKMLDGLILNRTPHIRLYNDIRPSEIQPIDLADEYKGRHNFISSIKPASIRKEIYNVQSIQERLKADDRVEGVAPKIVAQVFYTLGNIDLNGVINGVDAEQEAKLFCFKDYVSGGNYYDIKNISNSIILGIGAANKMLAKVGDIIIVTTPSGEQFPLKVVGYFQSGIADYDKVQSYCSIATTQKLLGKTSNYISDLQVRLKDLNMAPAMAKEYRQIFSVDAEDIQTANAQFETGSNVRSIISYAVGITLLIVAGFGIYNILNMMIYEKMDTIAILKATGFAGSDVKKIFLTIAVSIGIFGVIVGSISGFLLSDLVNHIPFKTASLPKVEVFPVDFNPKYYIIAGIFALATTYFAGWFPARKASSVDPVIIIRGK